MLITVSYSLDDDDGEVLDAPELKRTKLEQSDNTETAPEEAESGHVWQESPAMGMRRGRRRTIKKSGYFSDEDASD